MDVGLDYLTLQRSAASLSGGEAQRIRLATQIGSRLMGVLYVLDEPSIGLHPRDNNRLLNTLKGLRDLGNTVLVVEHDEETIRTADWMLDLGPGAGEHGGEVVAEGTAGEHPEHPEFAHRGVSVRAAAGADPGEAAQRQRQMPDASSGRARTTSRISTCASRLGRLVCITGVSGSGKSTLMVEILYKALARHLHGVAHACPVSTIASKGWSISIRSSISTSRRSGARRAPTPAPTPGCSTTSASLFAELPESKIRGYKPGRFSFNVHGGRCEACQGQGQLRIEMQFLPDVYVPCDVCHGARFNRETLQVRFKDYNIAEVLDMTVDHALEVFAAFPPWSTACRRCRMSGLGYIRIGQPAPTLSGGEAQRVKLARELSKRATGQHAVRAGRALGGSARRRCAQADRGPAAPGGCAATAC